MTMVNIVTDNDADVYVAFQYVDSNDNPIDITGATFMMDLRRHAEDATAFLQLTSGDTGGIAIYDAPNGIFTLMITKEQLLALSIGDYDQSCIMTLNTVRVPMWSGTLTNNWGPTR
jgi:hypothetical protein